MAEFSHVTRHNDLRGTLSRLTCFDQINRSSGITQKDKKEYERTIGLFTESFIQQIKSFGVSITVLDNVSIASM